MKLNTFEVIYRYRTIRMGRHELEEAFGEQCNIMIGARVSNIPAKLILTGIDGTATIKYIPLSLVNDGE